MRFRTQNPHNLEWLEEYLELTDKEVEDCIKRSYMAWQDWKNTSLAVRCEKIMSVSRSMREREEELARRMALEMGKPMHEGLAEIEKCIFACEYLAKNIELWLEPERVKTDYKECWVEKASLGPILAIMPWNYPIWQTIRFAVPALIVGNTVLLKGASNVTGVSLILTEIFARELSPGVFQNLIMNHDQTSRAIVDPRVRAVTFTGSASGGRAIAKMAGQHLKKSVMELGGSDAYWVLSDADLDLAAKSCAETRLVNNGQSCISGKRFFVPQAQYEEFITKLIENISVKKIGDPLLPETNLGPLAGVKYHGILSAQVARLEHESKAQCLWRYESVIHGAQFPPEIWHCDPDLKWVHREEFFGPLAVVFPYENESEVPNLINQSPYGLGSGIFSTDLEKAMILSRELEVGMVVINDFLRSDPRIPFGGVKDSGYGRELSRYGVMEFVNLRSCVAN